ncbi:hypothetical protein IY145_01860 [Methylosinus sp. H3A]|uniref:hypothetical protein n=1 Tax=Methylosinus sp. H3A TaxID=2785786 RepID=UPI0018C3486B|nr:hypothetical protein [Methylosinus sp. H3A]MBG0808157.1 hypothetical protein [Methylosinus sp. H3A]
MKTICKVLSLAGVASLVCVAAAAAQSFGMTSPGAIRVTVSVPQQFTPIPQGMTAEDQQKLIESVRRRIYETSVAECTPLSEVYKADCRIVSVNVNLSLMNQGVGGGVTINVNGSSVYELTSRSK